MAYGCRPPLFTELLELDTRSVLSGVVVPMPMFPLGDWKMAELLNRCVPENWAIKFGVPAPPIPSSSLDVCANIVAARHKQKISHTTLLCFIESPLAPNCQNLLNEAGMK